MTDLQYVIHRRYPDTKWDYKAMVSRIKGKDVIYYTLKDHGKKSEGVETYSGQNYIVGSTGRSHSRHYSMKQVPKSIKPLVQRLKYAHRIKSWSKAKRVDFN